jgi:hypothetical protein
MVAPGPIDLAAASDDFAGSRLDPAWQLFNRDMVHVSLSGGALHLVPPRMCVWFHGDRGPLLYKIVRGDFVVTAAVRARRASDPEKPVGKLFQFGGLMARHGGASAENYVFNVVGERGGFLSVETKSTANGHSSVEGPEWPSGDAELRICRVGARFRLFKRALGARAWIEAITYDRPDLPPELQVGPFAYAYTEKPDLRASFDWVRFTKAATEADCTRD